MQNKGALKLLTVLLALACLYQLSFTFVSKRVERKAAEYAAQFAPEEQGKKEKDYLDSVKTQVVYNLGFIDFTYAEVKEKELNLGLDLRGGMNATLEIMAEDVVRALSNDCQEPEFDAAVKAASEASKKGEDFFEVFDEKYKGNLATVFNNTKMGGKVKANTSDDEIIDILKEETNVAFKNSVNILRNRIDRFGVAQPNIQELENNRILVELPGVKEPERMSKLLQGTASLEFWSTYTYKEVADVLAKVNSMLAQEDLKNRMIQQEEGADEAQQAAQQAYANNAGPLFSMLQSPGYDGPVIGLADKKDMEAIDAIFNREDVQAMLNGGNKSIRLMWGALPIDNGTIFELYAIHDTPDGQAPLDGGAISDAQAGYSSNGSTAEVDMAMNSDGARTWARLTRDNIGKHIAIVLDDCVYSAPRVNDEINGGRSQITGNFSIEEATDLANLLKSGKMPASARIINSSVVGPSLGHESIQMGMLSFLIAFCLVLIYMALFYRHAGLIADIALLCNIFFLMGILVSFGAVLTLPGIAGIVLTMGMAVDANVIIYERIKEELRAGKNLPTAITDGFSNAFSAILDGNITTIITGVVLFMFGSGPVQGFATTLIIGIITSLFCGLFITRLIILHFVEKGKNVKFSFKWNANFLSNTKFDFIKARKVSYIISSVLIIATLSSFLLRGFNQGVDFSGGRAYVVKFDKNVSDDVVRKQLSEVFVDTETGSFEVRQYGTATDNTKRIVTQYLYNDDSEQATMIVDSMIYQALAPLYGVESDSTKTTISRDEFASTETSEFGIIQSDKVGPSVAREIKVNSITAVLFSLLAIGLYIVIRFKKWQWGVGAVVSLAHNALLVMGLYSLGYGIFPFTLEVDQSFIAAVLTIIGYSINDTVVIFDRIREFNTLYPKRSIKDNINNAINSTLSRTINTSLTTAITLIAIIVFGGTVIRGFVVALLWGILVGTYSSVFVATPIAYDFMRKQEKKAAKESK